MSMVQVVFIFFRACLVNSAALAAENLALRQQLAILEQTAKCPRLRPRDDLLLMSQADLEELPGLEDETHGSSQILFLRTS